MAIRPDNVQFSTLLPNYIQIIPNPTGNMDVIGNILPYTFSFTFTATISGLSPDKTRCDLYGVNQNTGNKQLLTNTGFPSIYQNKQGEKATCFVEYGTDSITFSMTIENNTGAVAVLIDQTFALTVVQYKIPF